MAITFLKHGRSAHADERVVIDDEHGLADEILDGIVDRLLEVSHLPHIAATDHLLELAREVQPVSEIDEAIVDPIRITQLLMHCLWRQFAQGGLHQLHDVVAERFVSDEINP